MFLLRFVTVFKRNYFRKYELAVVGKLFVVAFAHKLETFSVFYFGKILFGFAVEDMNAVVIHSFGEILPRVFGVFKQVIVFSYFAVYAGFRVYPVNNAFYFNSARVVSAARFGNI